MAASSASQSKIKGAIIGHALGDALGLPSEFPPVKQYTGELVANRSVNRFAGTRNFVLGQVSDDTEMALALWYGILAQAPASTGSTGVGRYNRNKVISSYIEWANSGCPCLGHNTRALFKGITTVMGYTNRARKLLTDEQKSNGCLMRAYPLAILGLDPTEDCALTNPSPCCIEAVNIYCVSITQAIASHTRLSIYQHAVGLAKEPEILLALEHAGNPDPKVRDITETRGYVAHALYCAYWGLLHFNDYQSAIDAIITHSRRGNVVGDTDTNAAIAGALLGAYYGFDVISADARTGRFIDTMLSADTTQGDVPRPKKYEMSHQVLDHLLSSLSA
jgi:ADP-ribosyl-[dinitrogen reductase] hydrolase